MAPGLQGDLDSSGEASRASPPRISSRLSGLEDLILKLYGDSDSSQYGVSLQDFTRILSEIVEKYTGDEEKTRDVRDVLQSLRVGELALARACVAGNEKAWETLLTRYREPLYELGCSIAKDDVLGRELADSLYGDLYGVSTKGEQKPSKLNSYTGIGSLLGWLRTVLAQAFIDRYRREQRLSSLDEDEEEGAQPLPQMIQQPVEIVAGPDPRLDEATDAALASIKDEDRFIIASHYLDNQKLSNIAATLGVHESTISRRMEKITVKLRKAIRVGLLKRGMSQAEVEDAFLADVRDLHINVAARLKENTQETGTGAFSKQRVTSKTSDRKE